MKETDSVRLARMEERQINQGNLIEEFFAAQKEHNERFYQTRYQVLAMAAKQEGAWKTIGVFGALTVAVSSGVAWVVTLFFGR